MHIGKSYKLTEFIAWTRRRGYVLVVLSLAPVTAYQLLGLRWIAMPWPVAALLGTAASFIVGFRNAQTYRRTVDAQHVWTTITHLSRYWGIICRDLPKNTHQFQSLVRRHLAWLTALRYEARAPRVWETAEAPFNEEFRRRNFVVPERASPLDVELRRFLTPAEAIQIERARSKTSWLISAQSATLRAMYDAGELDFLHHTEMQRTLKDLLDQQSKVEHIKDFPYPRQYTAINSILIWSFAAVLPLCLVREFDKLNDYVEGFLAGQMTWLAIPFAVLLAWLYAALDQVGESTENPFQGGANDVPISQICRTLEAELRTLLGETVQPSQDVERTIVL
jgi:putative membrane protein